MTDQADIGIFGGSGFYSLMRDVREITVETPYGLPSDAISLAELAGRRVAFLPRHDRRHGIPPHRIPYRANVYAMRALGVKRIFAPCAAGSLLAEIRPGDFVICDQFIDRTWGRDDTFHDGPPVTHVPAADPYCPEMRDVVIDRAKAQRIPVHEKGTIVVIQGPRFSTRAESRWFSQMGGSVVGMTAYPEAVLARELGICLCNIALVTDYDVGLEGMAPVTHDEVLKVYRDNIDKLVTLLASSIEALPAQAGCPCRGQGVTAA